MHHHFTVEEYTFTIISFEPYLCRQKAYKIPHTDHDRGVQSIVYDLDRSHVRGYACTWVENSCEGSALAFHKKNNYKSLVLSVDCAFYRKPAILYTMADFFSNLSLCSTFYRQRNSYVHMPLQIQL